MYIDPEIKDFLHQNPYPSLSFLPIDGETVFFLQDGKRYLEQLLGNVPVEINFYEEPHAFIMRIDFLIENGSLYETEFYKDSPDVLNALRALSKQDHFSLLLYDKNTGFAQGKSFTFDRAILQLALIKKE